MSPEIANDAPAYEILPAAEARRLRDVFRDSVTARARKAVPQGAADADALTEGLSSLIIEAARKGTDMKQAELAALAQEGAAAIKSRRIVFEQSLHRSSPDATKYPSPVMGWKQKDDVAAAAKRRFEDRTVAELFGREDRLYLRVSGAGGVTSAAQGEIAAWLAGKGYSITDYAGGYATDAKGKQQFRIGKLLTDDDLREKFINDGSRTLGSLMVVVTRNVNDIANMSTGRAWSSCMGSGGLMFDPYVPREIAAGSLAAYLVSEKDPEILNPLARVILKPYVQQRSVANTLQACINRVFRRVAGRPEIFVQNKTYGLPNETFPALVRRFAEEQLNKDKEGTFRLDPKIYADGLPPEQQRAGGRNTPVNGLSIKV
ncbi:MAG: hypothetical protein ACAH80_16270 [Alphaproteobacteria bacterium]